MPAPRHPHPQSLALLQRRADAMRATPTFSERALWAVLSDSNLGVAFRRQVVIPPFIVDFLAPRSKLIVEVDGGYHARRATSDARRDAHLRRSGFRVLRLPEHLVLGDTAEALRRIRLALETH